MESEWTVEPCRWTWPGVISRAAEVLRKEGGKSLWFKVLGETIHRRMILTEVLLADPVETAPSVLPVTIEFLCREKVNEYLELRQDADPVEISRRFDLGHLCFVARYGGRLVYAVWAATSHVWIDYLAKEVQLRSDEIYLYEAFTSANFRGRNLPSAIWPEIVRYLRGFGYRRALGLVMPENSVACVEENTLASYRHDGVGQAWSVAVGLLPRESWFITARCSASCRNSDILGWSVADDRAFPALSRHFSWCS